MPLIVTEPARIGDEVRQPGYVLTDKDLAGRNIGALRRRGVVKWVDDEPGARRGVRRSTTEE